jgi:hypothetical protein
LGTGKKLSRSRTLSFSRMASHRPVQIGRRQNSPFCCLRSGQVGGRPSPPPTPYLSPDNPASPPGVTTNRPARTAGPCFNRPVRTADSASPRGKPPPLPPPPAPPVPHPLLVGTRRRSPRLLAHAGVSSSALSFVNGHTTRAPVADQSGIRFVHSLAFVPPDWPLPFPPASPRVFPSPIRASSNPSPSPHTFFSPWANQSSSPRTFLSSSQKFSAWPIPGRRSSVSTPPPPFVSPSFPSVWANHNPRLPSDGPPSPPRVFASSSPSLDRETLTRLPAFVGNPPLLLSSFVQHLSSSVPPLSVLAARSAAGLGREEEGIVGSHDLTDPEIWI